MIPRARASFIGEALNAAIDAAVSAAAGAVKAALPPPAPVMRTSTVVPYVDRIERMFLAVLRADGFDHVEARRHPMRRDAEIAARHECGAWCVVTVTDNFIEAAPDFTLNVLDRIDCYCVRRSP